MANKPKIRTKQGQFKKGTSGNPSGRPLGSRNRATLMAEQFLDGESEELMRQAVKLAKSGNLFALRLCLERVLPIRKERTIELELPPAHNALDLAANLQRILAAAGEGRITPSEAQVLTDVLSMQAHLFETADMERRIQELEEYKTKVQEFKGQMVHEMNRIAHEDRPRREQEMRDAEAIETHEDRKAS
jgi:hypothetical protein